MSNPMRYIKDLEAAGFQRNQAEAQDQMVLDAIEGDLATKSDLAVFKSDFKSDLAVHFERVESRLSHFQNRLEQFENRIEQSEERTGRRFVESELRIVTRLGFVVISTTSIAVAVMTWLSKI